MLLLLFSLPVLAQAAQTDSVDSRWIRPADRQSPAVWAYAVALCSACGPPRWKQAGRVRASDRVVDARELYDDYDGIGFVQEEPYPADALMRTTPRSGCA